MEKLPWLAKARNMVVFCITSTRVLLRLFCTVWMMAPIWVDRAAICITCDVAESMGKIHRPIWGTTKSAFSRTWANAVHPSVKPSISSTKYPRPGTRANTPVRVMRTSSRMVFALLRGSSSCTIWPMLSDAMLAALPTAVHHERKN